MRNNSITECICHECHFHRTNHSSEIINIRLNNIKTIICNRPSKMDKALILLTICNRYCKCICNLFYILKMVVHNRLFKITIFIFFQKSANTYSFTYIIVSI